MIWYHNIVSPRPRVSYLESLESLINRIRSLPAGTPEFRHNTKYFSENGAWCYNAEGTVPRWEYCTIPACPETPETGIEGFLKNFR